MDKPPILRPGGYNPLGVMISQQVLALPYSADIVNGLGAKWFRPPQAVRVASWAGACPPCLWAKQNGFDLILTIANSGGGGQPSRPPENLVIYQREIEAMLDQFDPRIIVIENEPNYRIFYTGSPKEYGEQLRAAARAIRGKGVALADGGLVSMLVAALVYRDYIERGRPAEAADFATRAGLNPAWLETEAGQAQLNFGLEYLGVCRSVLAGLAGDFYMNFHWYISDPQALSEAVSFLRRKTGLRILTNEIGQVTDDPADTRSILEGLAIMDVAPAVWFAMDGLGQLAARGLLNQDGTLRPTGEAYRAFSEEYYP